ncbi:HDA1 [Auxenochlorella protothecoides x Auxenochlorella symbiontica]
MLPVFCGACSAVHTVRSLRTGIACTHSMWQCSFPTPLMSSHRHSTPPLCLPPGGAGHASVLKVWDDIVAPAAERFRPDLILVSAGFDAHEDDPFQLLCYRTETYGELASRLCALATRLCEGRILFCLEGGYNTEALAASVTAVCSALLRRNEAPESPLLSVKDEGGIDEPAELADQVSAVIARVRQIHGLG